jgi:hypothetical protein
MVLEDKIARSGSIAANWAAIALTSYASPQTTLIWINASATGATIFAE